MSSTQSYDREGFHSEFFPDADDRAEVEAGAEALVNLSRAYRLADMHKRGSQNGLEAKPPSQGWRAGASCAISA